MTIRLGTYKHIRLFQCGWAISSYLFFEKVCWSVQFGLGKYVGRSHWHWQTGRKLQGYHGFLFEFLGIRLCVLNGTGE